MDSGYHVLVSSTTSIELMLTACSVGLNVTSLKWVGPSLDDQEVPPKIPPQLEYRETVKRCDAIGFPDGKSPSPNGEIDQIAIQTKESESSRDRSIRSGGSSLEDSTPSQDVADRERLQKMMQVSKDTF